MSKGRSYAVLVLCLAAAAACGGSSSISDTVVGPSSKCAVSVESSASTFGADGGTAAITVSTTRDCTWSATSNASWITLTPPVDGQGTGTVSFTVAPNATVSRRAGSVSVGDKVVSISQLGATPPAPNSPPAPPPAPPPSPGACPSGLTPTSASVDATGGTVPFAVQATDGCNWTATSQAPWITILSGASGSGGGQVSLSVDANTSTSPRSGQVSVGGLAFLVTQAGANGAPPPAPCPSGLNPNNGSIGAAGGTVTFNVQASASCTWTATTQAPWVMIAGGGSGTGNGQVSLTVETNTSTTARNAQVLVGSRTFFLSQAAGSSPAPCPSSLTPTSGSIGAAGGAVSFTVQAPSTCTWTAISQAPWITVSNDASGTGNGQVSLTVDANTSTSARSGQVLVGSSIFTVSQDAAPPPPCPTALAPTSADIASAGGALTFNVQADATCNWTATSQVSWITITAGSSGAANGTVTLSVSANTSSASRSGQVTVGALGFTVSQAASTPVTLNGQIANLSGTCPSLTFTVSGTNVYTDANTSFKHVACVDLSNGTQVTVNGEQDSTGTVYAQQVDAPKH